MSCNSCATKFNFFHKEMGCSNCGLSFCNKCLKQKCKIPNKGPSEYNVCKGCYLKLTAGSSVVHSTPIPPPDAYLKLAPNPPVSFKSNPFVNNYITSFYLRRLEMLENPVAPPITMYKQDPKFQSLRTGLCPVDQQLVDRLEKLKDDKSKLPPPSEGEIRKRLANLKGENNYVEGPSKHLFTPDTRTDQQKTDALLEQFMSERDIELAHNPQEKIEARLATLREKGVRPNEGPYISNLHDSSSSSEDEVDKVARKIMDEVALDEKCPLPLKSNAAPSKSLSHDSDDELKDSSPELPWCVLCNKDAKYRCIDCGGDLYCGECNTEVHKNWGDTDHRVVRYEKK